MACKRPHAPAPESPKQANFARLNELAQRHGVNLEDLLGDAARLAEISWEMGYADGLRAPVVPPRRPDDEAADEIGSARADPTP